MNTTAACAGNAPCDWINEKQTEARGSALSAIDPAQWPPETQWTLHVTAVSTSPSAIACFRLVMHDDTADAQSIGSPVVSSDVCVAQPDLGTPFLIESTPFALMAGTHFYGVQFHAEPGPTTSTGAVGVQKVEIVGRWTAP